MSLWLRVGAAAMLLGATQDAHAALDEVLAKRGNEIVAKKVGTHMLRVRSRGMLKEFAAEDGKVFAASWKGTSNLDLMSLLGTHAEAYRTALRARHQGLHGLVFSTPELSVSIVQAGRLMQGRVWLPGKMPTGVTLDALR